MEQAESAGHDDPMMRHIVVGRDMRKSSPKLADALKQGIRDFGAHVIDVGLVDTPFIYFAINHLGCCRRRADDGFAQSGELQRLQDFQDRRQARGHDDGPG